MTNHPNRKGKTGIPPSSPTPEQIREIRAATAMTQTEAAAVVYAGLRAWQEWEGGRRVMPAAAWELFLVKLTWRGVALPAKFSAHIAGLSKVRSASL